MACFVYACYGYVLSFGWNCVRKHSVVLERFPLIQAIKAWKNCSMFPPGNGYFFQEIVFVTARVK